MSAELQTNSLRLRVENIGGIKKPFEVEFEKGLNVIKAPNAAGKTSVIKALETIIGDVAPEDVLRDGGEEGSVTLTYNGKEYSARLLREGVERVKLDRDSEIPIYDSRTSLIAVALPENKILRKLSEGEVMFSDILENLSNAENYLVIAESIRELIPVHKNKLRMLELDSKESERIKSQIDVIRERINTVNKELEELAESPEQKELSEKIAKLRDELQKLKTKKRSLEKKLESKKKDEREKNNDLNGVNEDIAALEEKYPELDFEAKIAWYDSQIRNLDERRKKETEPLLKRLYTEKENIQREIKRIESGELEKGRCPFCAETCAKYSDNLMKIRLSEIEEEIKDVEARDKEISSRKRELNTEKSRVKEDKRKLGELRRRKEQLEKEEIPRIKEEINKLQEEISKNDEEIKKKDEEISSLEKQLEIEKVEMQKEREKKEKILAQLNEELSELESEKERLDSKYKMGVERTGKYETIKINELTKLAEFFEEKYTKEKLGARKTFNESIRKVFDRLGFKGFSKIEVSKEGHLEICREGGIKTTPRKLSTSERITLGVILMISAYEAYLKERVPIFVLDEVTLSYDPTRFKEIVNYLAERVPYLIITTVVPAGEEEMRVEHSF